MTKRIAISTGGGDAPGLNAVIRAATLAAINRGWEVYGIREGVEGLMSPERFEDGGVIPLTKHAVRGITHLGGTILGTTNRGNPFSYKVVDADGNEKTVDNSDRVVEAYKAHRFDAMIMIGGDGTMDIANQLSQKGIDIVGVPKTIDNDLDGTVVTFGFQTAVSFATECLGRLHSTAEAHNRVMVVEVMGRYAGWIALFSGVAATADVILMPEIPYDIEKVCEKIGRRDAVGREFSIVVVAEGALPVGGKMSMMEKAGDQRLGGCGDRVAHEIAERTGKSTRAVVLGHLLRGGTPVAYDRVLSLRFGAAAVRTLAAGNSGVMVALDPPTVRNVPLAEATHRMKTVPLDCDTMLTAREIGIEFGG